MWGGITNWRAFHPSVPELESYGGLLPKKKGEARDLALRKCAAP